MSRRVIVVAHNPAWKLAFETEAGQISAALGERLVGLHHIGSTAIPGIYAKPIIDFLMEVRDLTELDESSPALAALGYEVKGEFGIPGRRFFLKDDALGERSHHVHAFEAGTLGIDRHLAFRDFMIAHLQEAQAYSELKRELARKYPLDIDSYVEAKDPFIKEHEARALAWWKAPRKD